MEITISSDHMLFFIVLAALWLVVCFHRGEKLREEQRKKTIFNAEYLFTNQSKTASKEELDCYLGSVRQ